MDQVLVDILQKHEDVAELVVEGIPADFVVGGMSFCSNTCRRA